MRAVGIFDFRGGGTSLLLPELRKPQLDLRLCRYTQLAMQAPTHDQSDAELS